jgi:hypothetical protein
LGTYVDNCAYYGTDDVTESWFQAALGERLKIDFMGDLLYYLGVHYDWQTTKDGRLTVHLSQEGHIYKMLENNNMRSTDSHFPVSTPYRSGTPIDRIPHDGVTPEQKPQLVSSYQSIVGSLNWLSLSTRPDITTAVTLLASHLHNPSNGHLEAAQHVLCYLKGTPDWGLRYTQPDTTIAEYDPTECVRGNVAWPTDKVPRLNSYDRAYTFTDSNWGPQDASHPKEGELRKPM